MTDKKQLVCLRSPTGLPHGYDDNMLCPEHNGFKYFKAWNEWSETVFCMRTKRSYKDDNHEGCRTWDWPYESESPYNVDMTQFDCAHNPDFCGASTMPAIDDGDQMCYYIKETGADEMACGGDEWHLLKTDWFDDKYKDPSMCYKNVAEYSELYSHDGGSGRCESNYFKMIHYHNGNFNGTREYRCVKTRDSYWDYC